LVEDDEIREAAKFLFVHERVVVEFSGAATVAALRSGRIESAGRTVAAVVSGGNVDPGVIANL
jgi:threonine dehydratase